MIRGLAQQFGHDLRFVFRHRPLDDVHDHAGLAAEAAGAQGQFREMHDLLYAHQDALALEDLVAYSAQLGSTPADSATISRRDATPCASSGTWRAPRRVGWPEHRRSSQRVINGRRHYGAYDLDSLTEAFHAAQHRDAHGGHIARGLDVVEDLAAPSSRSS